MGIDCGRRWVLQSNAILISGGLLPGCISRYPSYDFAELEEELPGLAGEEFTTRCYIAGKSDEPVYFRMQHPEHGSRLLELREDCEREEAGRTCDGGYAAELYESEDMVKMDDPLLLLENHPKYTTGGGPGYYRLRVRRARYYLDENEEDWRYGLWLEKAWRSD